MSANSINTTSSTYTVLKPKPLPTILTSITCYALNYVTHRLLLCNKEKVFLYDLPNSQIVKKFTYAKELSQLYDNDIEIKAADAVILSNLWITLVNKKSFLFFNDKLEFTKIYSCSPNPLLNIQVLQRTNDLVTFREDHKAVKIWKFELTENVSSEKKNFEIAADIEKDKDKKKAHNMHSKREKASVKDDKDDDKQEKQRKLKELGLTFEVNIFMRKQLYIPQNRFLVKLAFSEELKILALALDNMEVMLFNLTSGDHIQTLSFSSGTEKEVNLTPHVSIDQEMLYYCDERRIAVYDLVLNEEILNQQHTFTSKITNFHTERANNNAGIYILTADEKIHVYSIALKKFLCTEDLKIGSDSHTNTALPTDSSSRAHKTASNFHQEAKNAIDLAESVRRDNLFRDFLLKARYQVATDMSATGLVTLFICKPGVLHAFEVMSSARVLLNSTVPIQKMALTNVPSDPKSSPRNSDEESFVRLEFNNFTATEYSLKNFANSPKKSSQSFVALWKQSNYEHNPNNDPVEELKAAPVLEVHTLLEEKMFVVITQTYVHVVSLRSNRMLSQNLIISDVTACIAIVLTFDTFGNYYVIFGTKKGTILVLECDFAMRTLNILKHMPKHTGVLALRHLRDTNHLISIGTEGDIFLYTFTKPNEANLFPTQQMHRLIWNQVTSIAFLNDKEIIAGLDNGAIQHVKFSWKTEKKLDSKLLEFHTSAIKHLAVPSDSEEMFVACCDDNVITCWQAGESVPRKVFRLGDSIRSMLFTIDLVHNQSELYVAMENMVVRLEYEHGNSALGMNKDDEGEWNEALSYRAKYYTRAVREGKTINPLITKAITDLVSYKQANKEVPLSNGPQMNKFIYHNPRYNNSKSLEADYIQYIGNNIPKRSQISVLDSILSGFYQKKVFGEPLTMKSEMNKLEKKTESKGLTSLITTTLKKYPVIKSFLIEKQKAKELEEMHKNTVLLLNITYSGEDDLEQQYKFLEDNHQIKRETLDEGYFRRAKVLFYKRPAKIDPTRTQDSQFHTPRKDDKTNLSKSPLKLPQLESDRKYMSPEAASVTERKKATKPKVAVPKIKHFKNYSEDLEKEMMRTAGFPSETLRSKQNEFIHRPLAETGYQSFSATKAPRSLKLNLNFAFSPSPRLPAVLSSRATPRANNVVTAVDDKLSIGAGDNTLRSPFFMTSRADLNRDVFVTEYKPAKSGSIPNVLSTFNNTWNTSFPKRNPKDFVALHSKGFKSKENADMFNHVLRLLLKNHYLLKSKGQKNNEGSGSPKRVNLDDDESIEYVPIEIKQYILEVNQRQMEILEDLVSVYEMHTGQKVNTDPTKNDDAYSPSKLEEEMEKENAFLEQILERVNQHGIESVSLTQMIRFKQIMRRRIETFSHLQAHIEISGMLRTNPMSPKEIQLKDELLRTFQQVKEIADLRSACFPAYFSPKLKSPGLELTSGKSLGSSKPWAPSSIGVKEAQVMLESIKRSIESVKVLEGNSSLIERHPTYGNSPKIGLESLRNLDLVSPRHTEESVHSGQELTKRNAGRSLTTLARGGLQAIRSWNDIISMKDALKGVSNAGKKTKIERRNSITGATHEIKNIYNRAGTKWEGVEKPGSGNPGSRSARGISSEGVKLERAETLLSKGVKVHTEEEEIIKKIEKAWKEKDFGYLRDFLLQKNAGSATESSLEKKEAENTKTIGEEDKGTEGDAKNSPKKKKKKRNPNINVSSGNVVTTTQAKSKKQEEEMQARAREGIMMDEMRINEKKEEEEEEENEVKDHMKHMKESAFATKKIELLSHPTKENVQKTLKYTFHQAGTPIAKQDKDEKTFDFKPSNFGASSIPQQTLGVPQPQDKLHLSASKGENKNGESGSPLQAVHQGNIAKIHKRNQSFLIRDKIERLQGAEELKPDPISKVTNKHKPKLKSKYDLGEIEIDPFTAGDETKTITFGSKADEGSVLKTKKTEETPLLDERHGLEKKKAKDRKKITEVMEKTEISNKTESHELDESRKKKTSFAESIRKSTGEDNTMMVTEPSVNKEKKQGKLAKLNSKYKASSFTTNRPKVSLLVKGEDKNPEGEDDSSRKGSVSKGRLSGFANNESTTQAKRKARMSKFKGDKVAKDKDKRKSDDENTDYDDISPSSGNGRENLYGSDDGFFASSGDGKFSVDEAKIGEDHINMLKDHKSKNELAESQMPSIAEKLDKVPQTRSKRNVKKKGTTGPKPTGSTEENKEHGKHEKVSTPCESSNKLDEQTNEEIKPEHENDAVEKKHGEIIPEGEERELSKQRTFRHSVKSRVVEPQHVEDILDDPLKLLQAVLNVGEVDQETKLDLYMYGTRKEALKEFVREVEDTIEHNIIKNTECAEQLADFFDMKLNNLLVTKVPLIQNSAKNTKFSRKYTFPHNVGNYDYEDNQSFLDQRSTIESEAEKLRRIAFQYQQTLLNNMKASTVSKCTPLSQANIGPKTKKGQIILSPTAFETLVQRKDELLLEQNCEHSSDDMSGGKKNATEEQEEIDLLARLNRLRRILMELKESDPEEFERLIMHFGENKKLYRIVMREVDAKEKAKRDLLAD